MEAHKTGSTMMGEAFAILMVSSMATISPVFGFQVLPSVSRNCLKSSTSPSVSSLFSSWSETDDWSALSEQENTGIDSADFFSRDFVGDVARSMEAWQHEQLQQQNWTAYSEEDLIINEMVDAVQHYGYTYEPTPGQPHLYDNPFDESSSTKTLTFEDEMGQEISMLVRCSESPEEMLIGEGIALPPLTEAERNDLTQLLAPLAATPDTGSNNNSNDVKTTIDSKGTNELQPSTFLLEAASKMFAMHASATGKDGQMAMDGRAIANWMQRSLGTDEPQPVRPHDPRVLRTLTSYSDFGAGYLTEANFQNLYVAAVRQALNGRARKLEQLHNTKEPSINTIFRDIRNHGIQTPVEVQRKLLEEKMRNTGAGMATTQEIRDLLAASETIMDECELVDGGATIVTTVDVDEATSIAELRRRQQMDLPSHTTMEFADDGTTPLWVNEGDHGEFQNQPCLCGWSDFGIGLLVDGQPYTFVLSVHQSLLPFFPFHLSFLFLLFLCGSVHFRGGVHWLHTGTNEWWFGCSISVKYIRTPMSMSRLFRTGAVSQMPSSAALVLSFIQYLLTYLLT